MSDAMTPPAETPRAIYTFEIPKKLADETGITSIGLVELTTRDETMAAKRAGKDAGKLMAAFATASLVEVNGNKLSAAEGEDTASYERLPAKIRALVLAAYNEINIPEEEEVESFLKAKRVRV